MTFSEKRMQLITDLLKLHQEVEFIVSDPEWKNPGCPRLGELRVEIDACILNLARLNDLESS